MRIGRFSDLSLGKGNVEEPKLRRSERILKRTMRALKRGKVNKQGKPMFKKRASNQDGASVSKEKLGIGSSSQIIKPTCSTCVKRHHGECLVNTNSFFGCGKDGHKVRDCPGIASRGRRVSKLLLLFQRMMLQQIGVSMHSLLEWRSRKRKRVMMMLVSSLPFVKI